MRSPAVVGFTTKDTPRQSKIFQKKQLAIHSMDFVGTTLSGYTPHGPRSEGPDLELLRWMSEALCVTIRRGRRIRTPEEARDGLPASSVHSGSFILYLRKSTFRSRCRTNRNVL
ncbi:hypothetical protein [Paenibacillus sp. FSL E2-8871]|uniref:hypothetical protein n=1 Tax=unclassified Paenibacillus TaxID=185978 RepID=UPI004046D075